MWTPFRRKEVKRHLILGGGELGQAILTIDATNAVNHARTNNDIIGELEDFRYFSVDDMYEQLGLDNIVGSFAINLIKREVVAVNGIYHNGRMHHTGYSLPGGEGLIQYVEGESVTPILEYRVLVNGLNANIEVTITNLSNAILSYSRDEGETWSIANNRVSMGRATRIPITISGTYRLKVTDSRGREFEENIDIVINLGNTPKLGDGLVPVRYTGIEVSESDRNDGIWYNYAGEDSRSWAFATRGGLTYVWIPRFAVNIDDIRFLKGNSNTPTDNSRITIDARAGNFSVPGGLGRHTTGRWVQVTEAPQDRGNLNKLTLINDGTRERI